MKIWRYIVDQLKKDTAITLLYVLESQGSSPGRKGFIMVVNEKGIFEGTIGGGIMEVKMIELAKYHLKKGTSLPIVKQQFHDKKRPKNQSGLICSGFQKIALIPLQQKDIPIITTIIQRKDTLSLIIDTRKGFHITTAAQAEKIEAIADKAFVYSTQIQRPKIIHIFGAGHVGLALAKQMALLGYRIIQYDDRPELPTLQKNHFAQQIKIIDYANLSLSLATHPADVVVIASFSYRSDKIMLQQLYKKTFAYIGMMGSEYKIATLKKELAKEGVTEKDLSHVFMPIGLNMYSQTAEEIAVSIAGQIILETNKYLPTGRTY